MSIDEFRKMALSLPETVEAAPGVFMPAAGAWGRRGMTSVRLRAALKTTVRGALAAAWTNTAPRTLARQRAPTM